MLLVAACFSVEFFAKSHDPAQLAPEPQKVASAQPLAPIAPAQPVVVKPAPAPIPESVFAKAATPNPQKNAAAPAPAPNPTPKEPGFGSIKLQGIFYSASHPSAIINGQRVEPNDHVGDVLVMDITSSTVTLAYQNQRKTLVLE